MEIGFKNLRGLEDTGDVTIKPLTILLGQNSSGKSTFLRAFPLIKQSVEARTTGPILWYGRFVDFGQFKDALSDKAKDKFIEFKFKFDLDHKRKRQTFYSRQTSLSNKIVRIKDSSIAIQVRGGGDSENLTYCSKITIEFHGFCVELDINRKNEVEYFVVDGEKVKVPKARAFNMGHNFFPRILIEEREERFLFSAARLLNRRGHEKIESIAGRSFAVETVNRLVSQLNISSNDDLFMSIKNQDAPVSFSRAVKEWKIDNKDYAQLKAWILSTIAIELIDSNDRHIEILSRNINYVAPLRATAERYYRPQDLSVDEVDFQGKNLALVLNNLSSTQKALFQDWCMDTFDFYPKTQYSGGNLTVNVKFKEADSEHNIADLGFGFSQILPIITQIWLGSVRRHGRPRRDDEIKLYAIEQPELHLHPKLQARLINAIIKVINYCKENKLRVYFILETHSETIVNAIGTRVYKEVISRNDINVVIFEKNSKKAQSKLKTVSYAKDGSLKNWPFGFFEEEISF